MGRIVAVWRMKGGCGKSSLGGQSGAWHGRARAAHAAVDVDAQGAVGFLLGQEGGLKARKIFARDGDPADAIVPTNSRSDLITADLRCAI
jgi:cellulose biosynthesis protein BcsQ